jgi:hypothetical protein
MDGPNYGMLRNLQVFRRIKAGNNSFAKRRS